MSAGGRSVMKLLELFWSFLKVGFTSFGGLSMVPLISSEMVSRGWMSATQVTDILAIAEMTPGPFGLNCATFAGMNAAGIPGAIIANIGVLAPTLTICAVISAALERFKSSRRMEHMMVGIRPASVGMIFGVILMLSLENYAPGWQLHWPSVIIGVMDLFLLMKCKCSIPLVIILSGVMSLLLAQLPI